MNLGFRVPLFNLSKCPRAYLATGSEVLFRHQDARSEGAASGVGAEVLGKMALR